MGLLFHLDSGCCDGVAVTLDSGCLDLVGITLDSSCSDGGCCFIKPMLL
jgi:hypothetical protein